MERKPEKWKLSPEEERFVEGFSKECNMAPEQYKEQIERKSPITDYRLILYMNNSFKPFLEDIKKLLSFDTVIYYNMRPPMGQGNFEVIYEKQVTGHNFDESGDFVLKAGSV